MLRLGLAAALALWADGAEAKAADGGTTCDANDETCAATKVKLTGRAGPNFRPTLTLC